MIRRIALGVVLLSACLAVADGPPEETVLAPLPHQGRSASRLVACLTREHMLYSSFDDSLSARAWTNYLSFLDFEHIYFLASDIERFRANEKQLDDRILDGDVAFAFDVFRVFRERLQNRYAYVQRLLEKGLDLNVDETYSWNRREAPWPRDEAEWNDLWRKRIKNEYLQRVVAREMAGTNIPPAMATNVAPAAAQTNAFGAAAQTNAPGAKSQVRAEELLAPEEFIRKRYRQIVTVYADSDAESVIQKYLSAVAQSFDPHSEFMSQSAEQDFNIQMNLSVTGIGASLRAEDGAAKVESIVPGGPADRDKRDIRLRPGDKIIAVAQGDGEAEVVLHWPLHKIVERIRGRKGTLVVLTVIPASDPTGTTTKQVDLVRDEVKLEEAAVKSRIEEVRGTNNAPRKVSVIRVPSFYANTKAWRRNSPEYRSSSGDVAEALGEAKKDQARGVLLDLRNNGGGYLPEAIRMAGLFIATGPVVQVRDRSGRNAQALFDEDEGVAYAGPLVILVNRLSASASEIVAGALQDYGRAVVVGDSKTHGKGTVQAVVRLGLDPKLGSAKVTTAMYYRISGSSTQLKGIAPDIVVPSPADRMDFGEEFLPNPVPWAKDVRASYTPLGTLAPVIALLRESSEKRRQNDSAYRMYQAVADRVTAMTKVKEVPLALAQRRKLAETEKELSDLWKNLDPDEDENDSDAAKNRRADPVLAEALRILSDLIDITDEIRKSAPRATRDGDVAHSTREWVQQRP